MASAQEDQGILSQFIEFLGLEGDEAENFMKEGMTRRGHKPVMTWADGDGKREDKGGSVLGMKSASSKRAAGGGPGWQYGS